MLGDSPMNPSRTPVRGSVLTTRCGLELLRLLLLPNRWAAEPLGDGLLRHLLLSCGASRRRADLDLRGASKRRQGQGQRLGAPGGTTLAAHRVCGGAGITVGAASPARPSAALRRRP